MIRRLCFALAAMVALSFSSAFAAPITLKLGHIADPKNPYAMGGEKFAELVKEKTGGSVIVQVFPSSQLGNQRDLLEGLTFGTVDLTLNSPGVMGNFVPEMGVFDLPFVFRDTGHAYRVLDTIGMEVAKLGEARGIKCLAYMENGVRHMTNSRNPIKKPADMAGLKFRVIEQPSYIEMMRLLGASATPMAFSELYTALEKGVIDGQENPLAHIATSRFFEVQKHVSLTGHIYAAEPLFISTIAWKKLSPEQQKAMQEAANEATKWQRDLCRKLESEYAATIEKSGKCSINSDVDVKAFAEATKPVQDTFAKKVKGGRELLDRIAAVK